MDFAEYADATKPSTVSLPIKNSHCDAVLHVSIWSLPFSNKIDLVECEIYCNADFSDSDLLLNGQVSIQRLQENNDKRYRGITTMVIFTLQLCLPLAQLFLMMWVSSCQITFAERKRIVKMPN